LKGIIFKLSWIVVTLSIICARIQCNEKLLNLLNLPLQRKNAKSKSRTVTIL